MPIRALDSPLRLAKRTYPMLRMTLDKPSEALATSDDMIKDSPLETEMRDLR
jgi:hypothetical protein